MATYKKIDEDREPLDCLEGFDTSRGLMVVHDEKKTFFDAQVECFRKGAKLADFSAPGIFDSVVAKIRDCRITSGSMTGEIIEREYAPFHVGLRLANGEGSWSNGQPLEDWQHCFFATGYLPNASKTCQEVTLWTGVDRLVTEPCNQPKGYICWFGEKLQSSQKGFEKEDLDPATGSMLNTESLLVIFPVIAGIVYMLYLPLTGCYGCFKSKKKSVNKKNKEAKKINPNAKKAKYQSTDPCKMLTRNYIFPGLIGQLVSFIFNRVVNNLRRESKRHLWDSSDEEERSYDDGGEPADPQQPPPDEKKSTSSVVAAT